MKIEHDISLFYGKATTEPNSDADEGVSSWGNFEIQNINTTIYYRDFSEDGDLNNTEIGLMSLYKLHRQADVFEILDSINCDSEEIAEAMLSVNGFKTHPFVLNWFELKEEYRKQRLGHLVFHVGLQSSGCEGHPLFLLPSTNENHAGFEFLTQFYLDADMNTEVIEGTRIVYCPMYNNRNSVIRKRKKLKKECI